MTELMNVDPPKTFTNKRAAFFPIKIRYSAAMEGGPSVFTTPLPYQSHIQTFPTPQLLYGEYTVIFTVHYLILGDQI